MADAQKTEEAQMLDTLDRHARTNLTAAWDGSPDSHNPRNIRRVCSCGQVIGRLPYPKGKPGRPVRFPLGGENFDQPHREHIAEVLTSLPGQRSEGDR